MKTHRRSTPLCPIGALAIGAIIFAAGCQQPLQLSNLMKTHLEPDQNAAAKERWDGVRGEVRLQVARQHLEAGRLGEADRHLEQAMGLARREPQAYVLMTRLRLEQGKLVEAREAIRLAVELTRADPEVWYWQGVVLQRYGEFEEALHSYQSAAALAPNKPEYLLAEAETLVALGRPAEALARVEARIDDFDSSAPLRLLAAKLDRSLGLRGPATDHARAALRLSEQDTRTAIDVADILYWAERYAEVVDLLQPLAERSADGSKATTPQPGTAAAAPAPKPFVLPASGCVQLASALLKLDRTRDALEALKPVLDGPDASLNAWSLAARARLLLGEPDTAAQLIAAAHRRFPATKESLLLASSIALQRRALDEAAALADQAAEMKPRDATSFCLLGTIFERQGQTEEARCRFARALEVEPGSPLAKALLAALPAPSTPDAARTPEAAP